MACKLLRALQADTFTASKELSFLTVIHYGTLNNFDYVEHINRRHHSDGAYGACHASRDSSAPPALCSTQAAR